MAARFEHWENDPFFVAAEEVQESADRMDSVYRRWMREMKLAADPASTVDASSSGELRRELHMALGTVKWQLEEFDRAVRSNDEACLAGEETRARHGQLVAAINHQIILAEAALKEANGDGNVPLSWVRLDKGERDELALFLASSMPAKQADAPVAEDLRVPENPSGGSERNEKAVDQTNGHRRTASASADIESWKVSIDIPADKQPNLPPPKIPSFSCISKVNLPKNGFRKWRGDQHHSDEMIPLRNQQSNRGMNACYEKGKSLLRSCTEESCAKELDGWLGTIHRQLQRSQYQIQYGRPFLVVIWAILVVMTIVVLAARAI